MEGFNGSVNAEAGPSRLRNHEQTQIRPPSRPIPETPPATPPSTAKSKRRSWFGFGSPNVTPTSTPTGPSKMQEEQSRVTRSSVGYRGAGADGAGEHEGPEIELGSVIRRSTDGGPAAGRALVEQSGTNQRDGRMSGDELMTIDGQLVNTIRKKKKRKSGSHPDPDLDVMRMEDLGWKAHSRFFSERTIRPEEERGNHMYQYNPHPSPIQISSLPPRTFSRTASDRDPFISPVPTPRASSSSLDGRPSLQLQSNSPLAYTASSPQQHPDKSQPPIPVDMDRPLPPLPPPGSISKLAIPDLPTGIVVTPSSPQNSSRTPRRPPDTERRTRSATGRPREVVPAKRANSTVPLANGTIGLGLPSSLVPSTSASSGFTESPPPPPVPAKTQSVSSPFPSRSASPIPRIAFVEPEVPTFRPQDSEEPPEEKRHKVRRARSLSGIFGRSPTIVQGQAIKGDENAGRASASETKENPISESVGKTSGVLEWLGVRKTSKRKMSMADPKKSPILDSHDDGMEHLIQDEKNRSRESYGPPLNGSRESINQQQTPRQPDIQSIRSMNTTTSGPSSGTGKLTSIFNRRASARNTDDESDSPSVQIAPVPIPNAGRRNQTATSSQSSFNLPPVDPISPFIPNSGPWISSPQTEGEETLFSPTGSANWGPGVRPWMDESERQSMKSSANSPLNSLPEQSMMPTLSPLKPPPTLREGRVRSWSDAPLPPQRVSNTGSNPHLPIPRPTTPSQQPSPATASPKTPSRPGLGSRSNSGNAAILGRMKSVFSKSTNRSRSNSLLRQASSEIDEFGNITLQGYEPPKLRPSTSSSSVTSATAARGRTSAGDDAALLALGPQIAQSREPSPRTSFTPSMSSLGSTFRQSALPEPPQGESKAVRKTRARASTIALGPTSYNFVPPSPNIFPIAATPPRRRPGTIHRISNGLFGSGPSSPRSSSLFPLPPRSSGSISSSVTTTAPQWEESSTGFLSPGTSPRPSTGSISAAMSNAAVKQASVRDEEETPKQWLERVVATVGRQDISNVLAASGDEFHTEALQAYMATFDFTHNALDVALRRLLMHMSLPKETQQIDRVIEAFAQRYEQCEPALFGAKDNTYVLAFSMMMLHTDAFNKHNKNKMTKPDYVRNTRMEGVSPLVLEAFFDNITYTSFVFIEDDTDLKRSSGYESSSSTFGPSTPTFSAGLQTPNVSAPGKAKIDVYHMIVRGLLGSLRVDLERQIPYESPFSCFGTKPLMDMDGAARAFANAYSLMIPASATERNRKVPGKLTTPVRRHTGGEHRFDHVRAQAHETESVLRVTKIGLLYRKDDAGDMSKKASRKWKSWSVLLTGSQLLFFKDPTWALNLLEQARTAEGTDKDGQLSLPKQANFKPDEVLPVKDCIAVYDRSYNASSNTFRFVMPQSRQYLLQASDEYEMNDWITLINYASTFKTANLKMKSSHSTMRKDQVVLAGAAAAASHKRELKGGGSQSSLGSAGKKTVFGEPNGLGLGLTEPKDDKFGDGNGADNSVSLTADGAPAVSGDNLNLKPTSNSNSNSTSTLTLMSTSAPSHPHIHVHMHTPKVKRSSKVDVDETTNIDHHESEQLEEVFGVVKAELAAGRGEAGINANAANVAESVINRKDVSPTKEAVEVKKAPVHTSRVAQVYEHLRRLREECAPLEESLRSSLLVARNIALLTPFQKSTRDRLQSSISPIAHRIRSDRLTLAKLRLWIRILEHEGEREDREWKVVRHVALQAAARSLREDGVRGVVRDVNLELEQQNGEEGKKIPKLALPTSVTDMSDQGENGRGGNAEDGFNPIDLPVKVSKSNSSSLSPLTPHSQHEFQSTSPAIRGHALLPNPANGAKASAAQRRPSTTEATTSSSTSASRSASTSSSAHRGGQKAPLRRVNSANDLLSPRYQSRRSSEDVRVAQTRNDHASRGTEDDSKDNSRSSTFLMPNGYEGRGQAQVPDVTEVGKGAGAGDESEGGERREGGVKNGRTTPIIMFHMESPLDIDREMEKESPFVPSPSSGPASAGLEPTKDVTNAHDSDHSLEDEDERQHSRDSREMTDASASNGAVASHRTEGDAPRRSRANDEERRGEETASALEESGLDPLGDLNAQRDDEEEVRSEDKVDPPRDANEQPPERGDRVTLEDGKGGREEKASTGDGNGPTEKPQQWAITRAAKRVSLVLSGGSSST